MGTGEYLGRAIKLVSSVCASLIVILWLIIPLANGLMNSTRAGDAIFVFRQVFWGTNGEELLKLVIAFAIVGIIAKTGAHLQEHELRKRAETEERILGYLKLSGRTSIESLAQKVGMSSVELTRILATIRQNRDVIFFIEDNDIYMPGYERERPKEIVREVVKEVIKMPCSHCSSLVDPNTTKCPNCGAPL
jgi:hypothetical protein